MAKEEAIEVANHPFRSVPRRKSPTAMESFCKSCNKSLVERECFPSLCVLSLVEISFAWEAWLQLSFKEKPRIRTHTCMRLLPDFSCLQYAAICFRLSRGLHFYLPHKFHSSPLTCHVLSGFQCYQLSPQKTDSLSPETLRRRGGGAFVGWSWGLGLKMHLNPSQNMSKSCSFGQSVEVRCGKIIFFFPPESKIARVGQESLSTRESRFI